MSVWSTRYSMGEHWKVGNRWVWGRGEEEAFEKAKIIVAGMFFSDT